MPFGVEKNYRMVWRPDCENVEDIFIRFDRIHERTPHDDIGRACIASCGKNGDFYQHLTISWSVECSQHVVSTMR